MYYTDFLVLTRYPITNTPPFVSRRDEKNDAHLSVKMDAIMGKATTTNLVSHGEKVTEFRFRANENNNPYTKQQVYGRADVLRLKLRWENHLGVYS